VSSKHIEDARNYNTHTLTLPNLFGTRFDVGAVQLLVMEELNIE